jgi:hypothetical protein
VIAEATAEKPDLVAEIIAQLDGDIGRAAAEGLNANTGFLSTLLANLDKSLGKAMADGSNVNGDFMQGLLENLDDRSGRAVGEALGSAQQGFMDNLFGNLKADTGKRMAEAMNEAAANVKPGQVPFMQALMEHMSPATSKALAEGLNASAERTGFITSLITNLDENAGKAVSAGLNAMAADGKTSPLYATLVDSGQNTVTVLANALNESGGFLKALIGGIDPAELALDINEGINAEGSPGGGPGFFLRENMDATDPEVMAGVMASEEATELLGKLLGNPEPGSTSLDPALVANALNGTAGNNYDDGIKPLITSLVEGLEPTEMARIMNETEGSFMMNMDLVNTPGLADMMARAVNRSTFHPPYFDASGNALPRSQLTVNEESMLHKLGFGQLLRATVLIDDRIIPGWSPPIKYKLEFIEIIGFGIIQEWGTGELVTPEEVRDPAHTPMF